MSSILKIIEIVYVLSYEPSLQNPILLHLTLTAHLNLNSAYGLAQPCTEDRASESSKSWIFQNSSLIHPFTQSLTSVIIWQSTKLIKLDSLVEVRWSRWRVNKSRERSSNLPVAMFWKWRVCYGQTRMIGKIKVTYFVIVKCGRL